jgi:hypothetical protein
LIETLSGTVAAATVLRQSRNWRVLLSCGQIAESLVEARSLTESRHRDWNLMTEPGIEGRRRNRRFLVTNTYLLAQANDDLV